MKKNKNLLSTGEFAKLCKTTKETLFHYDRENLLKPKYVLENGYRRYGVEQFFDFDMIAMFKEVGGTLKEIRAYINNVDGKDFLKLLETKQIAIREERKRLALLEKMLSDMTTFTREALEFDYDTFMLQEQQEERLEVFKVSAAPEDSMREHIEFWAEYVEFYYKQNRIPRLPFGIILAREALLQAQSLERCFFSQATRTTPRSMLYVKPAGLYAVIAHKGTEKTHQETLAKLMQNIRAKKLTVAGDGYMYDMMSYTLQGGSDRYAAKYCVPVK